MNREQESRVEFKSISFFYISKKREFFRIGKRVSEKDNIDKWSFELNGRFQTTQLSSQQLLRVTVACHVSEWVRSVPKYCARQTRTCFDPMKIWIRLVQHFYTPPLTLSFNLINSRFILNCIISRYLRRAAVASMFFALFKSYSGLINNFFTLHWLSMFTCCEISFHV
jgi:hypothetical protein